MIPESRLPQTASVERRSETADDWGNPAGWQQVSGYTGIPCRVTRNRSFQNTDIESMLGSAVSSEHLIFMNLSYGGTAITIKTADKIVVGSKEYVVTYVDDAPGGKEDHHQQIYANKFKDD